MEKINKQLLFFGYKKNNKTNKSKKPYYKLIPMELNTIYKKIIINKFKIISETSSLKEQDSEKI